jgi:beta-lactamase regulating signal transducer with metallopeptidase domain
MVAAFIDAALRSLLLATLVWSGLRIFRVRNFPAQRATWAAVLAGALFMPVLLVISARWNVFPSETLVIPTRLVSMQSSLAPDRQTASADLPAEPDAAPEPDLPDAPKATRHAIASQVQSPTLAIPTKPTLAAAAPVKQQANGLRPATWAAFAVGLYVLVATGFLIRLVCGLASILRLWHVSRPALLGNAYRHHSDLNVRSSRDVLSPVTIGSGVLLPEDYAEWDQEKLRVVLAHERAHICNRDFYWQILASLYAALVWFSPLGWWLKHELSDLGEAISDRAGLEEARNRSAYARILLEFAAAPNPNFIGVAMARKSNISRRIERLLNDRVFHQAVAVSRRVRAAFLLAPFALFAFTALVRVEAAAVTPLPGAPGPLQAPITGQSNPNAAPAKASPATAPVPAAAPAPAQSAPLSSPVHVDVPPMHVSVPAMHFDMPAQHIDVPAMHVDVPGQHIDVPAMHVDVPAQHVDVPAVHVNTPAVHVDVPAQHIDVPAIHIDVPPTGAQNTPGYRYFNSPGGELYAMLSGSHGAIFSGSVHGMMQAAQPESTFDRTLTANGKLDLRVATGSGYIHLTRGSANQVKIHARVRAQQGADAAQVNQIVANPPIEQSGSTIRIGAQHQEGMNHISIDYDIEAPADCALEAATGSGNITDEGVGQDAKLMTGSGNIMATGLQGGFKTQTGSGNISIENSGQGDATAQTGSGTIDLKSVHGSLKAETGSGKIVADGTPAGEWKLQTGSGEIELSIGKAPATLDASTGSGSIKTDQAMATQNSSDHHHLHAQLNGGGPTVRVETGSGSIRIQ